MNTPLDGSALSMHIEALEKLLLDGTTRRSATDLEHLLAEDFVEVGQSGRRYSRAEIVTELANEQPAQLSLSAFTLSPLAETVMLATYVAERRDAAGIVLRSQRSSIWQYRQDCWQLVFHQGTAMRADTH